MFTTTQVIREINCGFDRYTLVVTNNRQVFDILLPTILDKILSTILTTINIKLELTTGKDVSKTTGLCQTFKISLRQI